MRDELAAITSHFIRGIILTFSVSEFGINPSKHSVTFSKVLLVKNQSYTFLHTILFLNQTHKICMSSYILVL